MPAQNIIDALGISWKLDTSSDYATLSYNHPVLGLLQYTGTAIWIADNVNTVHLTSRGSLPAPEDEGYVKVLPDSVCIRPLYDSNGCGCYDLVTYDNVDNQCACKDPGCDCIPEKMCLDCDGTVECCTGNACIGGREGVNAPSGPSRELCCTLLGVNVCSVWYCSAGQWKVDIYCNDVLITTNDISHEGCPLKLGTTSFDGCEDCVVCVGEDCDPDPPDGLNCCCEPVSVPGTLTATLYDAGNAVICTVTITGGPTSWSGTNTCGPTTYDITMSCVEFAPGTCLMGVDMDCGLGGLSLTQSSLDCSPFEWTSTSTGGSGLACGVDYIVVTV
jgi:hypothetical protein